MRPLLPSLSHRSFTIKKVGEAPGIRKAEDGVLYTPNRTKTDSSHKAEKISSDLKTSQIADQLSPHHDSQFSAFSTEVLIRFRPGHNCSSSPFTTLADKAEHRVASTGAGKPNY